MTRLKHLLLAGTMVPALVLMPLASAFAQQGPDTGDPKTQRKGPEGARPAPGAERVKPPGRATPAAPAVAPNRAERPAPGVQAPTRAERPAPAAPAAPPPTRAERATPAERAAPRAEKPAPAAPAKAAPTKAERPTPAERAAPRAERPAPAAPAAPPPTKAERATPAERAAPRAEKPAPVAPAAPAPTRAERPATGVPAAPNRAERALPAEGTVPGARAVPGQPAPRAEPRGLNTGERAPQAVPGQVVPGEATAPAARPVPGAGRPGEPGRGPNAATGNAGPPPAVNNQQRGDRGISPGGAAAIGAAAGFAGGFLAATGARDLAGIRGDRRESVEDGRTYIREPGRTIVEDGDRSYIVHDENDRFRELGYDVRRERSGADFVDVIDRPDGTRILTYTTPDGRMLRRVRRYRDGREFVLIDNGYGGRVRPIQDDIVDLPPPPIDIPRERYAVNYADVDEGVIYDTFAAPPLRAPPRRYTLDQIRYSPDIRRYVRSVDINTINFDSGSWIVPGAATGKLQALATAIKRTLGKDPNSVFLVEGYTDATGNPTDNLSLSDRRAQSVAAILSKDFGVPPENLTTQGYGQQNLKVNTQGPSVENRRVVVQNITPLLAAGGSAPR